MKSFIHWRHALVAPLVLVLLLSLALVSPVHAAKKPNRNNNNLKTKQVFVVQKHAAEQVARQYGYYQRPGSKGSGSSQSPGGKGR